MESTSLFSKQRGNEMKDVNGKILFRGKEYRLVFNLNVMEAIQEEYGSLEKWGALTDGADGEVNAKAVIFGFREMLNEGIDIMNEENGTNDPFLTLKQTGRMVTEIGMQDATSALNQTVVDSTKTAEKN